MLRLPMVPRDRHRVAARSRRLGALGAVLARTSGTTLSDLLSDLVWSRIGAAQDGRYVLDEAGVETACGGFAATLRDIALIGEMLRCGGALDGTQIVPEAVVRSLTTVPDGATARVRLPRASASSPATMSYRDGTVGAEALRRCARRRAASASAMTAKAGFQRSHCSASRASSVFAVRATTRKRSG